MPNFRLYKLVILTGSYSSVTPCNKVVFKPLLRVLLSHMVQPPSHRVYLEGVVIGVLPMPHPEDYEVIAAGPTCFLAVLVLSAQGVPRLLSVPQIPHRSLVFVLSNHCSCRATSDKI